MDKYYIDEESSERAKNIANKLVGNLNDLNNLNFKENKKSSKINKSIKIEKINKYTKKKIKVYKNPYVKSKSKFIVGLKKFFQNNNFGDYQKRK